MRFNTSRAARANPEQSTERFYRSGVTVSRSRACVCVQTGRAHGQALRLGVVASLLCTITCLTVTAAFAEGPLKFPDSQFEPIKWAELAGWTADDHLAAFAAYQTSCHALGKRRSENREQLSRILSNVCRKAVDLQPQDASTARVFFEQNFRPVRIGRLGQPEGLLTGYFEPIVAGSRFPSPEFTVPLYRRPRDLVAVGYKPGSIAFPNKSAKIGRRTENNEIVPYFDRGAIEAGALDGQKLEICWLRDPLDLLAIQIEGSGRVILEDGTPLRVSFDSHNGYRFSSIERVLIDRNLIPRNELSTQRIRDWMAAHPDEAAKVRAANRSYVFLRVTGLSNEGEPIGAQGVPLTPGRSIAVDRAHEYGTPFFIEANLPIESGKSVLPFRRLMIAQDTGSAIVGPTRADLYWGAGDDAGRIASRIRHPGHFVMLLPRELDFFVAGGEIPLPVPKPNTTTFEVRKQGGKDKANSTNAGMIATGRQKPSPAPKLVTLQVGKQVSKSRTNSAYANEITTGGQKSAPEPTPKIAVREAGKQDRNSKADSPHAGVIATGGQKSAPEPTPKIAVRETGKQDRNSRADSPHAGVIATGGQKSVSEPTPKIAALEAGKQHSKSMADPHHHGVIATGGQKPASEPTPKTAVREAGKQDSKSKANSANAGAIAASGEQKTSLAQKPRTPGIEVKKRGDVRAANGGGDRTVVGRSSSAAMSFISSGAGMRLIRAESQPLRQ
jgi:peptidoglycan lytic transglycosylase A